MYCLFLILQSTDYARNLLCSAVILPFCGEHPFGLILYPQWHYFTVQYTQILVIIFPALHWNLTLTSYLTSSSQTSSFWLRYVLVHALSLLNYLISAVCDLFYFSLTYTTHHRWISLAWFVGIFLIFLIFL